MERPVQAQAQVIRVLAIAAAVLAAFALVIWGSGWARAEQGAANVAGSSFRSIGASGGLSIELSAESRLDAARAPVALQLRSQVQEQGPVISVGRDCPALLLADGSVGVTVTISSPVALSVVTVADDAGTAELYEDDILLTLIDGDLNADAVLDPGELWVLTGAFFAGPAAIGDTVYGNGQDAGAIVVSGAATCEALPVVVPPAEPPVEEPAVEEPAPTATSIPAEQAQAEESEDDFTAAVLPDPTVTISKNPNTFFVEAGDEISFNLTVRNEPDSPPIFDVLMTDNLPTNPGLDWELDDQSPSGICRIEGEVGAEILFCEDTRLEGGEAMVARVFSETTLASCGEVENSATVVWADDNGGPEAGSETVGPVFIDVFCPTIIVEKVAVEDTISAGEDAVFEITISNISAESDVDFVELTDILTPGISWSVDNIDDCSFVGDELFCEFTGPDAGDPPIVVTLTGETNADVCGNLINTAIAEEVAGSNTTSFSAAQLGTESTATIIIECADVVVTKAAVDDSISAGENAEFTMTVTNNGVSTATVVELYDELPDGPTWTTETEECSIFDGEGGESLLCELPDLGPTESFQVEISGATDASDCGTIFNSASVYAENEAEPDQANNDSEEVSIEVLCPDLALAKTPDTTPISAGEVAEFDLTVQNNGLGSAFEVSLTDPLPFIVFDDWTENSDDCSIQTFTLICDFGTLLQTESRTVRISARTSAVDCGPVDNLDATVSASNEAQEDLTNNTASASITVNCPELTILKAAVDDRVSAGEDAVFRIDVGNSGAGTAFDLEVIDELPPGVDWEITEDTTGEGECEITGNPGSQVLSCGLFDLGSLGSFTVEVTGTTDPTDCAAVLENIADVSASNDPADFETTAVSSATIEVVCPNLSIEKTTDTEFIEAGDLARYTIEVSNVAPGSAFDVTIDDTLPAGIVWTEVDDLQNCTITGQELHCDVGTLVTEGTFSVSVEGQTSGEDCGVIQNDATANASNDDPVTSEMAEIFVLCAELSVTKEAGSASINAGGTASYEITVQNIGSAVATEVTLTDTLPAGVSWSVDNESCEIVGSLMTCNLGDITSLPVVITVSGPVDNETCGDLVNSATADATNTDPVTSEPETITVNCPVLAVTKEEESGTVNAGETAAFDISVDNLGPGIAFDVTLTDELPSGVDWTVDREGCEIAANVLTCDLGDLNFDADGDVTVSGATDAADCAAPLTNDATADGTNTAPVTSETATITVICPSLTVAKSAESATVTKGDPAVFNMLVGNEGPGTALGVSLTDQLPAGVDWSTETLGCELPDDVLTCGLGDLEGNGTAGVTVSGDTDAAACGDLVNSATADATNDDPVTSAPATITVLCPTLTVVKAAESDTVIKGDPAVYTITVGNGGPGIARDVSLTDELPAGVAWSEGSDACAIAGNILTCNFGDLASTGTAAVTVSGDTTATDCGDIVNTATVNATNNAGDPVTSEPATITVVCPSLTVTKAAVDATVNAGGAAGYVITVGNNGPGIASGVSLTDQLPAGIPWSTDDDGCAIAGRVLTCGLGDLGPIETIEITVTGATDEADCGTLLNVAAANATNAANPVTSPTASITVVCPVDLTVTKEADEAEVAPGAEIGFTLTVTNQESGTATAVTLTDVLPANLGLAWTIDEDESDDGCEIDDGNLACFFGDLGAGETVTTHIVSPTTDESCGTVANSATASASNEGIGDQGNNTADASITVDCPDLPASISLVKIATDGLGSEIETVEIEDVITYVYVVANTGAVPLTDITLLDDHFEIEGNLCPTGTTLEPDDGVAGSGLDEIICVGEYLVGEIDTTDEDGFALTNVATVNGTPAVGEVATATDTTTVTISELLDPCSFEVVFNFIDDIDFTRLGSNDPAFTLPEGFRIVLGAGEIIERGGVAVGCNQPFTIYPGPDDNTVLARGRLRIYLADEVAFAGGIRALPLMITSGTLVVEITEVTAWAVPGVPAPEPEIEEVQATIVVAGPVMEIETKEVEAAILIEPELEVPFVKTKEYWISKPELPDTGIGTAPGSRLGLAGGFATMLPALVGLAWLRRRSLFAA